MDASDLTNDAFLGGRLHLLQPRKGYRAGVDPVLLAASIPATSGQSVLELGCGVATALLCLNTRVAGLSLTGVEVQTAYADLARRNAGGNAVIVESDLRNLPDTIRQKQYDHVMMNPPYFDRATGNEAADKGRDLGRGGDTLLSDWLDVGIKRVAPKGHLTLIQHINRLPDVLAALDGRMGSMIVKLVTPRQGKPPNLFLLQARQAGRAPFVIDAPLVMHTGDAHMKDSESYTPQVAGILRNGESLPIGH